MSASPPSSITRRTSPPGTPPTPPHDPDTPIHPPAQPNAPAAAGLPDEAVRSPTSAKATVGLLPQQPSLLHRRRTLTRTALHPAHAQAAPERGKTPAGISPCVRLRGGLRGNAPTRGPLPRSRRPPPVQGPRRRSRPVQRQPWWRT